MPRDDSAYLLDMLLAARDAVSFSVDMSFDDFVRDRRTHLSLLKSVEIAGVADFPGVHVQGRQQGQGPVPPVGVRAAKGQ